MNPIDQARASVIGRFKTAELMKDPGPMNLRTQEPTTGASVHLRRRPLTTKASLNDHEQGDIALYDIRNRNSLMMSEELGSMAMHTELKNKVRERMKMMNEEWLPNKSMRYTLDPNALPDGSSRLMKDAYHPRLQCSVTNRAPTDMTILDPRMIEHTNDRDYNYESDQIANAVNVYKSPQRWARVERQNEADRKLMGMGSGMDRFTDNSVGYVDRPRVDRMFMYDQVARSMPSASDIDDQRVIGSLSKVQQPVPFQAYDMNRGQWDNHLFSGNRDGVYERHLNQYQFDNKMKEPFKGPIDKIVDTIFKAFGRERKEEYLVRDGMVMKNMPADEAGAYCSMWNDNASRLSAFVDNGKLHVVQQLESDRIFHGDLKPVKDDMFITVFPKSYTERLRLVPEDGRKFVNLDEKTFEDIVDFIQNHPGSQVRVKKSQLEAIMRDNEIDSNMLNGYGSAFVTGEWLEHQRASQRETIDAEKQREMFSRDDAVPDVETVGQQATSRDMGTAHERLYGRFKQELSDESVQSKGMSRDHFSDEVMPRSSISFSRFNII